MSQTYTYTHPRPALSVDIVVFHSEGDRLQVLLVRRGQPPFAGCWALPGGFVGIDESLDDAARRELEEETGVRQAEVRQFYAYGDPDRDPRGRVVTVAYYALIPGKVPVQGGDDAAEARWFAVDDLPELAFDHAQIIHDALQHLRRNMRNSIV